MPNCNNDNNDNCNNELMTVITQNSFQFNSAVHYVQKLAPVGLSCLNWFFPCFALILSWIIWIQLFKFSDPVFPYTWLLKDLRESLSIFQLVNVGQTIKFSHFLYKSQTSYTKYRIQFVWLGLFWYSSSAQWVR